MIEPNEAVIKTPDDWRGVLWRERLREALNITSDLDHRSWRDIKRALAAMSPDNDRTETEQPKYGPTKWSKDFLNKAYEMGRDTGNVPKWNDGVALDPAGRSRS